MSLSYWRWKIDELIDNIKMILTILSFMLVLIVFAMILILIPVRLSVNAEIGQYKTTETTIMEARNKSISEIERAAIQNKIIESNKWLANARYYNSLPILNWYFPKEIEKLQYLK